MDKNKAVHILLDIDEGYRHKTIIDDTWEEYLEEDAKTLKALKEVTGKSTYKEILDEFEGHSILGMLQTLKLINISG